MALQLRSFIAAALLAASLAPANAETVRIAFMDPLSGAFAPIGQNFLHTYEMMVDVANQDKLAGENTLQVTGFDNKGSPQETLTQLKTVIDQGYRYVAQGVGSGAGLALIDAINKHNQRNPGKEIVYLNHAAVDPDMTNSKCSFWHFRFDASSDMKMEAMTKRMASDPNVKKVYLINQNYSFGQQVGRAAKEYLKEKRADIEIVGDDLHPIGQVKDFSPYVAKIKASGADTIITGNFGADLALLIKAAKDAGLDANFYTYYAGSTGVPTAMGAAGADRVKQISYFHPNIEGLPGKGLVEAFKKKYDDDLYGTDINTAVTMLAKAIREAKSTEPIKVAYAMEDMQLEAINGDVTMRGSDHQLQQPLFISTWTKVNGKDVVFDQENTGYGWKTDVRIDAQSASLPTTCQMQRPARP